MAVSHLCRFLQRLRKTAARQTAGDLGDGELLESFVARRDQVAFENLLRRHGPMVWGVCRRILANEADAEDAFQATFLVLIQKASAIDPGAMVGNWLYGVAHNTALKAKAMSRKRQAKEREAGEKPRPERPDEVWEQLRGLLDEELSCLPNMYRAPIVLCDLEGKTRKQAADQLSWPEGTVATRLARGRARLAERLTRRGLALSGGALVNVLGVGPVWAGALPAKSMATVKAVAAQAVSLSAPAKVMAAGAVSARVVALTKGVIRTIFLGKMKQGLVAVSTAGVLWVGAALLWQPQLIEGQGPISGGQKAGRKDGPAKQAGSKSDAEKIQGAWRMTAMIMDGKEIATAQDKKSFYLTGEKFISTQFGWYDGDSPYTLDESQQPKAIDLSARRGRETMRCIYKLKGAELIICSPKSANMDRPKEFTAKPGSNLILTIYKRDPNALKLDLEKVEAQKEIKTKRLASGRNLFRIGEAMRKYHDAQGCFPPAAICDASGKPLLSWRVALLPHLGEDNLYQQFKLDEPWDSEDNKKLLAQMPEVFGPEGEKTYYQVFTGEGTVFDGTKGIKERDITDSPAHTVLVVEAGQAVPWTKPQDLPYSAGRPLPKLGAEGAMAAIPPGHRTHGFYILAVDGVTHRIPMRFNEKVLRSLITRAGGESAFFEDLEKMQDGNAK
jgi:RNA polymerase sigma factor (sigma-70 family)